jgi:hypothetical protein
VQAESIKNPYEINNKVVTAEGRVALKDDLATVVEDGPRGLHGKSIWI